MILRIGRRRGSSAASRLLQRPRAAGAAGAGTSSTSSIEAATIADSASRSLSSSSSSSSYTVFRGFASQPAAADDSAYDNQPGFDEDEEVTVNTWLQGEER
jgi:hypothetical protein